MALATGSCQYAQHDDARGSEVREAWNQGWIAASSDHARLAQEFDRYVKSGRRDTDAFDRLTKALDTAHTTIPLSGAQAIDILGPPKLWLRDQYGVTFLVYVYPKSSSDEEACIVSVEKDGLVRTFGWTAFVQDHYRGYSNW